MYNNYRGRTLDQMDQMNVGSDIEEDPSVVNNRMNRQRSFNLR